MQPVRRFIKSIIGPALARRQSAKRADEIRKERSLVQESDLKKGFDAIPVPPKATVLVHSSLKSIGFVEGGADAVVRQMMASFVADRGITLMLPTYTLSGTMLDTLTSGTLFDVRNTPSNVGALPEAFRKQPGAHRSIHPTHSFAAVGPKAEWLTESHHLAGTNFGIGTPMARMLETDSFIMGLGSDIGHVTFYHCLEDMEPFPLTVHSPAGPFDVACMDWQGQEVRLRLNAMQPGPLTERRIDHPSSGALRAYYLARLQANAGLTWHKIGSAPCWLIPARSMYDEIRKMMLEDITIYTPANDVPAIA